MPEKMFDGPVHGNFWTANILIHDGELFLIDFGSVVKFSLEYDLLYANRTLTRRTESWVKGWCSLETKYIKHYSAYGEKARLVLRNLEENYSFYYAFLAALKTASSLNANKPKRAGDYFEKLGRALNV
jgi:thiamine kinase-like enzyme